MFEREIEFGTKRIPCEPIKGYNIELLVVSLSCLELIAIKK